MRFLWLFLGTLVSFSALAEDLEVQSDVEATRWLDADLVSISLSKGDTVQVVYRTEGSVRVKAGREFGWVSEARLAPAKVELIPPAVLPPIE
jgi:hypothetical protein